MLDHGEYLQNQTKIKEMMPKNLDELIEFKRAIPAKALEKM